MTSTQRHAQSAERRFHGVINRLTRLYLMRQRAERPTAWLLARCQRINDAYIAALDAQRSATEQAA